MRNEPSCAVWALKCHIEFNMSSCHSFSHAWVFWKAFISSLNKRWSVAWARKSKVRARRVDVNTSARSRSFFLSSWRWRQGWVRWRNGQSWHFLLYFPVAIRSESDPSGALQTNSTREHHSPCVIQQIVASFTENFIQYCSFTGVSCCYPDVAFWWLTPLSWLGLCHVNHSSL